MSQFGSILIEKMRSEKHLCVYGLNWIGLDWIVVSSVVIFHVLRWANEREQ